MLSSIGLLAACGPQFPQSSFHPVSEFGRALNSLIVNTLWWTIPILVLVELLIVFAIFRFRARPGQPKPKQIHGNVKLEALWTIIPAVIVLFISIPTIQMTFTTQRQAPGDALTIEVVGHQWWWEFRYPEYGVTTANEMYLPVDRNINLKMYSADVIHSFWIPRVGGKRDVNPHPRAAPGDPVAKSNYLTFNIDEPGYYSGQCAEFCGASHAIMRTAVIAVQLDSFNAWVNRMGGTVPAAVQAAPAELAEAQERALADSLARAQTAPVPAVAQTPLQAPALPAAPLTEVERGKQLFTSKVCIACHTVAGTNARGVLGPNLTLFGTRRYVGAGARPNTLENVEAWITNPQALKLGALMPGAQVGGAGMPPTGLKPDEVRAIARYLESLK